MSKKYDVLIQPFEYPKDRRSAGSCRRRCPEEGELPEDGRGGAEEAALGKMRCT